MNHQRHPNAERRGKCPRCRRRAAHRQPPLRPKGREQRPSNGRQQKHSRGLGQHHEGEKQPDPHAYQHRPSESPEPHREIQGRQRECGQHRFQDRQPAEAVKKRTGHHKRNHKQRHPPRSARAKEPIAQDQVGKKEGHRQPPCGFNRNPGDAEQYPLEKWPHRHRRRGVEVAAQVPVPEQVGAHRRIPIPAFIGVLGPIGNPRSVVGKVRAQMKCMQNGKAANHDQPDSVCPTPGSNCQVASFSSEVIRVRKPSKLVRPRTAPCPILARYRVRRDRSSVHFLGPQIYRRGHVRTCRTA